MKKTVMAMLFLMLLNLCVPGARAEMSQDLDPMVSSEPQAAVTNESSASATAAGQTSNVVSAVDMAKEKKKTEEAKKKKVKKSSVKKVSSKKSSKSSSEKSQTSKNSSH